MLEHASCNFRVYPATLILSICLLITIPAIAVDQPLEPTEDTDRTTLSVERAALIKTGRAKAQGCTRCHGRLGMARFTARAGWENSVSTYVIKQLLLFRGNKRSHEIMNAVAKPLSSADIYAIALWYESVSQ